MNHSSASNSDNSAGRRTTSKRRQTINGWLLLVSAAVLFILAPALYFWHYFQTVRLSDSFLVRAEELEDQHDPHAAAEYLQRYLQIKPENAEVRMRLAEVYDSAATDFPSKRRSTELYYQAIGWAEKEKVPALRARVGEILLETGQYLAAEKEALALIEGTRELAKEQPANKEYSALHAKGLRLRALAIVGQAEQGSWKKSEEDKRSLCEILEEALRANPNDHELIRSIVKIYRDEPQYPAADKQSLTPEERNLQADRYLDDLISTRPDDVEALLMRYSYRRFYRLPDAEADLELAMQKGKDNVRVLLAKADADQLAAQEQSRRSGRIDESIPLYESAMKYYQEVLQISENKLKAENAEGKDIKVKSRADAQSSPTSVNWREIQQYAWVNLGTIQKIRGDAEAALNTWKTGLEKIPHSFALNLLVADTLLELGRLDEVARGDNSKQEGPLDVLETLVMRINTDAIAIEDVQEVKYREQVKALEQTVHLLRGKWHHQRGESQLAMPLLQQVAQGNNHTLQQSNEILQAYMLLGDMYLRSDQMDQAAAAFESAAALNLRNALPHLGAAKAWETLGRYDLAEKHLREALELQDSPQKRLQLAQLLLRREMLKPIAGRQWAKFDKALEGVQDSKGQVDPQLAWEWDLLKIQAAYSRDGSPDTATAHNTALGQLRKLEEKYPDVTALKETLIPLYASLNATEDAERVADRYAKLLPREAKPYTLRSRVAVSGRQFDRAQSILEEGIRQVPPEEQSDLIREIVGLDISQNHLKDAGERLTAYLHKGGDQKRLSWDSDTIKLVFAMALQTLDKEQPSESKRWEDELVRIEGQQGTLWRYCRARRLVILAKDRNDPQLAEAESLLAELRKMRPSWGQGFLVEAVILQNQGKLEDAVDAYRTAIQYGCRNAAVYEKLVGLFGRLGRYTDIERCLEDLGATQEQTALAERLMSRDPKAAEIALRKALKTDAGSSRARQQLAQLLAARGGEQEWTEALDLLSGTLANPEEERLNQALKAKLLAARGGKKNLAEARAIVEKLVSDEKEARPEERMLLARIYESEGNFEEARKQLRTVVESPNSNASQVAAYLDFLLQSGLPSAENSAGQQKEEIERWLNKLQELAPENLQTFALKARFFKKYGSPDKIEPLIEGWVKMIQPKIPPKAADEIHIYEKVGDLYSMLQLHAAAERWYRRVMEKDSGRYRNVARSLARQGRFDAALQICEEAAKTDSSVQPLATAALIMLAGQPSLKDYERANALLAKGEDAHREDSEFLNVLAALRIQESRMDEATSLLRLVVELRPRDAVAINNLATVLAEQPDKLSEGKKLLEEALALAGPQAGLLDLQGVILIAEGKPREAIPLFEEACAAPQADPRYCFHGAVAYKRSGDLKKAEEALQRARNLNLDQQILTPGDKELLAELEQVLRR